MSIESIIFHGQEMTFLLPSGKKIDIRETNGQDEENFSKLKNQADGSFISKTLAGIITKDHDLGRQPTEAEIDEWKIKDRYYSLFISRVFSLGNEYEFKNTCTVETCSDFNIPQKYEQDLSEFYTNGKSDDDRREFGDEGYTPQKYGITSYPLKSAKSHELITSRGTRVRFDILTGVHEKAALEMLGDEQSETTKMIQRNLSYFHNEQWIKVTIMGIFSSKETREIRTAIKAYDSLFEPIIEITCKCGTKYTKAPFNSRDFFLPEGI